MFVFKNQILAVYRGLLIAQLYNRIVIRLTHRFCGCLRSLVEEALGQAFALAYRGCLANGCLRVIASGRLLVCGACIQYSIMSAFAVGGDFFWKTV